MDARKRIEVRTELVSQGYSFGYVDSWPPKVTLWAHRDLLNTTGQVAVAKGTEMPNHPGHPDHLARKSRIGLLSWPPSKSCQCKACRESRIVTQPAEEAGVEEQAVVTVVRGRPAGSKNKRRATAGRRAGKGD